MAEVSGLARGTIHRGLKEMAAPHVKSALVQVRASGGGRKPIVARDPGLLERL